MATSQTMASTSRCGGTQRLVEDPSVRAEERARRQERAGNGPPTSTRACPVATAHDMSTTVATLRHAVLALVERTLGPAPVFRAAQLHTLTPYVNPLSANTRTTACAFSTVGHQAAHQLGMPSLTGNPYRVSGVLCAAAARERMRLAYVPAPTGELPGRVRRRFFTLPPYTLP